jgi:hypothetical protein
MQRCGLEFTADTIQRVREVLEETPSISRRALSRRLCEAMEWRSANGKLKELNCRKALLVLEREGLVELPRSEVSYTFNGPRTVSEQPSTEIVPIACELSELGAIEIELVTSRYCKAARIWKDLMDHYHYLGGGPLCGGQIRYLVHSSRHGYVGALSFSSATWAIKARDEHIGWSEAAHRANIQKVIGNSRFLILPMVRTPNLASHTLSRCLDRVAQDWLTCYGVEPVLVETFVDPERFSGASYRAANWVHVGKTSGRRAAQREAQGGPKDVFIYPLSSQWRTILHQTPPMEWRHKPHCRDGADWVEEEFGSVEFYDPRLKRRLFTLARDFYSQPRAPITQACQGSPAKAKAVYRFFRNERVCMQRVLHPHVESSAERIKTHKVVLAVQDTTDLNYTGHPALDMGPINTTKDQAVGLLVHDTMAFTVEGTPLGLLDVQCWARDPKEIGKSDQRKQLPIEQKESMKWLRSYRAVREIQSLCPETMLVSVGDRESDIYELFLEAAQSPHGPQLLVRCERSRQRKAGEVNLWEKVNREPVSGIRVVRVPRKGTQPAREATLEVRHARVTLKPPKDKKYPPVAVWMVYAKEVHYGPQVKKPLDWMLLTTVEVSGFEDACERLDWYTKRWCIEVYHRTLKSGCKIEDRQLGLAEGLEACLAIDMVVAWRIYHLTSLAREVPDVPCSVFFEEAEWKALYIFKRKSTVLPAKPPSLREAVRMTASLGGFLGRKGDGEPGTTTLWRGLQRLDDITEALLIALPHLKSGP